MVAIIRSSGSAKRCCEYNERKVEAGLADCIMAGNYPCEASDLTARQRMLVLQKRLELNERVRKGCLHIVLSFPPEQNLVLDQLKKISQTYIDHIGLAGQPFLVYQHLDTRHPHLHLVTVTVKADGTGNSIFHARQAQLKDLTGQIQKDYQLTPSQALAKEVSKAESAQKLQYGKIPLAQAISQVLSVVVENFRYGSIAELNAVLRHYNLIAKPGKPGSKTHRYQGLSYQMLTEDGRKIGASVKASRLWGKPTLSYLRERFKANATAVLPDQQRVRTLIDLALIAPGTRSVADLGQALSREGVKAVYGIDQAGRLSEIFFVDFRTRSVFSASRLGGRHTPSRLLLHFKDSENAMHPAGQFNGHSPQRAQDQILAGPPQRLDDNQKQASAPPGDENLLKLLLDPVFLADYPPKQLRRRLNKKRRQIQLQL